MFLQHLLAVIAANCENNSESDKQLVNESDTRVSWGCCSYIEVNKADEVSEVGFIEEIDDELHQGSKID